MKVQDGHIPAYLVEATGPVVVAWCTSCGLRTVKPLKAMMDRYGEVITDGCGDCSVVSASQPARIEDDGLGPVFIVHGTTALSYEDGETLPRLLPPFRRIPSFRRIPPHTPAIPRLPRLAPASPG